MSKILDAELICGDPKFYKFMQVHEHEEYQVVILENEA